MTSAGASLLVIELPLPPRELSSNGSHGHWRKHSTAVSMYRTECYVRARAQMSPVRRDNPPQRVRVSYEVCTKGGRAVGRYQPRDATNAVAALKAAQDALVSAGALMDDSQRHMELGSVRIEPGEGPYVRCTIEELGGPE